MRIAIVGAGLAGLTCAQTLRATGHTVCLFDKGRGPGGRMSTRHATLGNHTLTFDHGAQYFTARDPTFLAQVRGWEAAGLAAPWPAAGPDAWVGTPTMNAPLAAMAALADVSFQAQATALLRRDGAWYLTGHNIDPLPFDSVLLALPAEQAAALLAPHHPGLAHQAASVPSRPCWTVMAVFDQPLAVTRNIIRDSGNLAWAARNASKPGRASHETWVLQASPEWSAAHRGADDDRIITDLLSQFGRLCDMTLPAPVLAQAHSWLYARSGSLGRPCLWDRELQLGVCGDWLLGPRVECAWQSGKALAAAIAGAP